MLLNIAKLSHHHLTTPQRYADTPNDANKGPTTRAVDAHLAPRAAPPKIVAVLEAPPPPPAPVPPQAQVQFIGTTLTTDAPAVAIPTAGTQLTSIIHIRDEGNPRPYPYHIRSSAPLNAVSLLISLICCVSI